MKKIILFSLLASVLFSACTKEIKTDYTAKTYVEFDANIFNAPVTPYPYTVVTRVVPYGYASATTYPLISRTSGTIKLRVNLVGTAPSGKDQVITYKVLTAGITPVSPNALAVEGTHFTTTGTLTIPANSLFGELTLTILNPGVSSTTLREVHLELQGNSEIKVTGTSNKVAVRISQA